jgi:DME family drug/metabolite transporter
MPVRQSQRGPLTAVIVAAGLWGLGGTVASRLFSLGADPIEVVVVRTWIAAAGLIGLLLWRGPRRLPRPFPWLLVTALGVSIMIANAALFLAISRLHVAVAFVLQNLAPVFVVGAALAAVRRRPPLRTVAGLLAALAGVALVVGLPTVPVGRIDGTGIALGLVCAIAVAAMTVLGGRAVRACGALPANAGAFTVASIIWLGFQVPRGVPRLFVTPELAAGTIVVGIFGTLLPFLLYSWGTSRLGPQVGAVNISLEPLFGGVLAWAWLGQTLDLLQVVGGVVLLTAVIDLQRLREPGPAVALAAQLPAWRPGGAPGEELGAGDLARVVPDGGEVARPG